LSTATASFVLSSTIFWHQSYDCLEVGR